MSRCCLVFLYFFSWLMLLSCNSEISVSTFDSSSSLSNIIGPKTVTISSVERESTANSIIVVKVLFGSPINDLTKDNFTITNGTILGINTIDNKSFFLEVSLRNDLTLTLKLPANAVIMNGNEFNEESNTFTISQVKLKNYVQFSKVVQSVNDQAGSVDIQISLGQPHTEDVEVEYLVSGKALYGVDHAAKNSKITIIAGNTTATETIAIYDTSVDKQDTALVFSLYSVDKSDVFIGEQNYSIITIQNTTSPKTKTYKSIFSARDNFCAISSNDKLKCFGRNQNGVLGNGTTNPILSPEEIDGTTNYKYWTATRFSEKSCGITTLNKLKCWGTASNNFGIGDGTTISQYTPQPILAGQDISKIHLTYSSAYAITTTGTLYAWGRNSGSTYKYLGDGGSVDQHTPTIIDSGESYIEVDGDSRSLCGITTSNDLKCWGQNFYGEVGDGTTDPIYTPKHVDIGEKYTTLQFSHGYANRFCGLTTSNELKCWGQNNTAMGSGDSSYNNVLVPTLIDSGESYIDIQLNEFTTCGITNLNKVKCFGANWEGEQGNLDFIDIAVPREIDGGFNVKKLFSGGFDYNTNAHYCALTLADNLICWGANNDGQLGIGDDLDNEAPRIVSSEKYKELALTPYYYNTVSCGITLNGSLKCAGETAYNFLPTLQELSSFKQAAPNKDLDLDYLNNLKGSSNYVVKLNNGSVISQANGQAKLKKINTSIDFKFIESIQDYSNYNSHCGINENDDLYCWGKNFQNRFNILSNPSEIDTPLQVDPGVKYKKVKITTNNVCGITTNNKLRCAGEYFSGFEPINLTQDYSDIFVNNLSICVTRDITNSLECIGNNDHGQLGDGGTVNLNEFKVIDLGYSYKHVSIGNFSSCGITTTNKLRCWGRSYPGDGTFHQPYGGTPATPILPTDIDNAESYSIVHSNANNTCALTLGGQIKCWGNNLYGQVGNNSKTNQLSPTLIDSGETYKQISIPQVYNCGITTSNKLKCWGFNKKNGLINNGRTDILVPTGIASSFDFNKFIHLNATHDMCLATTSNQLLCRDEIDEYSISHYWQTMLE